MRTLKRLCPGFTLVELLVVITIIGILIALLLPAVQAAREAARRGQCQNHLKQLALACQSHEQLWNHFPTGGWGVWWVGDPDRGFGKDQPGGWLYNLLPYIEQDVLHGLGSGMSEEAKWSVNAIILSTPVATYYCPSRRSPIAAPNSFNAGALNAYAPSVLGHNDYCGNSGDTIPNGCPGGPTYLEGAATYNWGRHARKSGVIFARSMVRMSDIYDGSSYTIAIGEGYLSSDYYATSEGTANDQGWCIGYDYNNCRWVSVGATPDTALTPLQDQPGYNDYNSFGSAHSTSCHFAFCDGSVQSINYNIDGTTFFRLGVRNDNQVVDSKQY